MVSSVVGFYSSPLFTGLLPRAQDTNLTQVPSGQQAHIFHPETVVFAKDGNL